MCELFSGGDDCAEVWKQTQVTARKAHKCDCCGGLIRPQQKYVRHFSIFEGYVTSEKMCVECRCVSDDFMEIHKVDFPPGYMETALRECVAAERDGGDATAAARWELALAAMAKRALAAEATE